MSIKEWLGFGPRVSRGASYANVFVDNVDSIGDVDSTNLAEEGLGYRTLAQGVVGSRRFRQVNNTRTTITTVTTPAGTGGTWLQWQPGPVNQFRSGAIAFDEYDSLLVRACVQLSSEPALGSGIAPATALRLRIAWNDGGGTTGGGTVTLSIGPSASPGAASRRDGYLETFVVIPGSKNLNWVELQYQMYESSVLGPGAPSVSPARSSLVATLYRRCS
jgi:hypothetical protein